MRQCREGRLPIGPIPVPVRPPVSSRTWRQSNTSDAAKNGVARRRGRSLLIDPQRLMLIRVMSTSSAIQATPAHMVANAVPASPASHDPSEPLSPPSSRAKSATRRMVAVAVHKIWSSMAGVRVTTKSSEATRRRWPHSCMAGLTTSGAARRAACRPGETGRVLMPSQLHSDVDMVRAKGFGDTGLLVSGVLSSIGRMASSAVAVCLLTETETTVRHSAHGSQGHT